MSSQNVSTIYCLYKDGVFTGKLCICGTEANNLLNQNRKVQANINLLQQAGFPPCILDEKYTYIFSQLNNIASITEEQLSLEIANVTSYSLQTSNIA